MEEKSYNSTHPLGHTGPVKGTLYLYIWLKGMAEGDSYPNFSIHTTREGRF